MAKTGLDELFRIASKVSSNGYSSSKGLSDLVDLLGRTRIAKHKADEDTKYAAGNQQSASSELNEQGQTRQESAKKTVGDQVDAVNAVNNAANDAAKAAEIFSFEINDQRLVDGFIFSEILGRPVSRKRRGHGRFR